MDDRSLIQSIHRFYRRYRRPLLAFYWIGMLPFVVLIVFPTMRTRLLNRLEHTATHLDNRWSARVKFGEKLVKDGKHKRAIDYLNHLDRRFPAQQIQHKRDAERERILDALGRSYTSLGRKQMALGTYRRLVAFDPRNFMNHHRMAMACDHFNEIDEASEYSRRVLRIHPTHVPSLRRTVSYYFNRGNFDAVIDAYEQYLDAFLIHNVTVSLGDTSSTASVAVDGNYHDLEIRLAQPRGWAGTLVLDTSGISITVNHVTLQPQGVMGRLSDGDPFVISGSELWTTKDFEPVPGGLYRATSPDSALTRKIPTQAQGVARIRMRIRLFKTHIADIWQLVQTSYRTRVDPKGLNTARSRSPLGRQPDT